VLRAPGFRSCNGLVQLLPGVSTCATAHWLLQFNAACGVVLTGRSGRGGSNLSRNGNNVVTATRADAACASEAAAALHSSSGFNFASVGDVTSVFNVGGVLTDALAANQAPGRLQAVVAPKVPGGRY